MSQGKEQATHALLGLALLAVALLGCKGLSERLGSKSAASASAVATTPAVAATTAPATPVVRNPRVVDAVDQIRLFCHYTPQGTFDRCDKRPFEQGARLASTELLNDPSFVETLSVILLEEKNPRLVRAAAGLLAGSGFHVQTGLDKAKNPKAESFVSTATAGRLLQALGTVPQAADAVDEIVWIATARGLLAETTAMLGKLPGDAAKASETRRRGMGSLMDFGGMAAFEQVQAFGQSGNPDDVAAAARAPVSMRGRSEADSARICPWLKELLAKPGDRASSAAASAMMYVCPSDYAAILANFERHVGAVTVTQSLLMPFHSVCRPPEETALDKPPAADEARPLTPTPEQCAAGYALLQKVVDDARFDQMVREIAFGIFSGRADAETLRVCTLWKVKAKSPDFRIPEAATRCAKRVTAALQAKAAGK